MSEESTGKIVHYTYDPANPPRLTAEERARLDAIRDEDIDLSDIPEQTGKRGFHPGLYGAAAAEMRRTALREGLLVVEPEIIEFFKSSDDQPQDRMNAVLREYVQSHCKSA